MPRRCPSLAVASLVLALAIGCSGPGGVTLGHDWAGVSSFALVEADGLVTVVGIDAERGRVESLAVVPQQADDMTDGRDGSSGAAPQIVELADGRRLVTVPRQGGRTDRLYVLDPRARSLDALGMGEGPSRVAAGKTLVGEVAGLPEAGTGTTRVAVRNPADWSVQRGVGVPGTVRFLASDAGSDTVCLATDRKIFVVKLASGELEGAGPAAGIAGLACPGGRPLAVVTEAAGEADAPRAQLGGTATATTVTVRGGRIDAVAADPASVVLAVAAGDATELLAIDTGTGKELRRIRISAHPASLALTRSPAGWLLYDEESVTLIDPSSGRTRRIPLPGTLLDA